MKKPSRFETSNNNNSRKYSSAHKHLVRLTPAASRLRSTATYFHPLTTHGFENAQLMVLSGAQNVSYSEPGVQGGRPRRSAPKAQINIKYMFYILSGKNRNMTVWPSGLRRWLQAPVRKGVGSNPTAVRSYLLSDMVLIANWEPSQARRAQVGLWPTTPRQLLTSGAQTCAAPPR